MRSTRLCVGPRTVKPGPGDGRGQTQRRVVLVELAGLGDEDGDRVAGIGRGEGGEVVRAQAPALRPAVAPTTVRSRARIDPASRAGARRPGVTRWTCTPGRRPISRAERGRPRSRDGCRRRPSRSGTRDRRGCRSTTVDAVGRVGGRGRDRARSSRPIRRAPPRPRAPGRRWSPTPVSATLALDDVPGGVDEDDRGHADHRVARGGLLERDVGRTDIVARTRQPDLGQDLVRLRPVVNGTLEEAVDAVVRSPLDRADRRAPRRARAGRPAGPRPDRRGRSTHRSCPGCGPGRRRSAAGRRRAGRSALTGDSSSSA